MFMCVACVMVYICNHLLVLFLLFCKPNGHLWNGANWCTPNLAHILNLRFLPHCHFCDSSVLVHPFVYALPSSSILKHIYRHTYMYTCFDYSVMFPYNLYTPIIMRLCVPAGTGCSCAHVWTPTPCAVIQLEWFEYTTKYIEQHINNISCIK